MQTERQIILYDENGWIWQISEAQLEQLEQCEPSKRMALVAEIIMDKVSKDALGGEGD